MTVETWRWPSRVPLWKAFWLYYCVGQILAALVLIAFVDTRMVGRILAPLHLSLKPAQFVLYILAVSLAYVLFVMASAVVVWLAAKNARRALWGYLARGVTLLHVFWTMAKFAPIGAVYVAGYLSGH
jgi:hypothetical protein